MSAARKPVIVRTLHQICYPGFISAEFTDNEAELDLLDSAGKLLRLPWSSIKWICFVRDLPAVPLSPADSAGPERILRRKFNSRPRIPGLWLRITLLDGDELEGVSANDQTLISAPGLLITPPDSRSNTQKIFIPRAAVRALQVLAVVAAASPGRKAAGLQPDLFDSPTEDMY